MKAKQVALVIERMTLAAKQLALAISRRLWQLNSGYGDCTDWKGN